MMYLYLDHTLRFIHTFLFIFKVRDFCSDIPPTTPAGSFSGCNHALGEGFRGMTTLSLSKAVPSGMAGTLEPCCPFS